MFNLYLFLKILYRNVVWNIKTNQFNIIVWSLAGWVLGSRPSSSKFKWKSLHAWSVVIFYLVPGVRNRKFYLVPGVRNGKMYLVPNDSYEKFYLAVKGLSTPSTMKGHQYMLVSSVVIFPFQPASNFNVLGSHQRNTASEDHITQWCHLSHQYRGGTRSGQESNLVGLRIWDFSLFIVYLRALLLDVGL